MEEIELHEYREVSEIWNLIPQTQWEYYVAIGVEDQREQLLLNAALKILKTTFIKQIMTKDQDEEFIKELI